MRFETKLCVERTGRLSDRCQNLLRLSRRIQREVGEIVSVNAAHHQLHVDLMSVVLCTNGPELPSNSRQLYLIVLPSSKRTFVSPTAI